MRDHVTLRSQWLVRPSARGSLLCVVMLGGWTTAATAQAVAPRSLPIGIKDLAVRNVADAPTIVPPAEGNAAQKESDGAAPRVEMSNITIRTDTPAVPGAKLVLKIDREGMEGSQLRWSQVEGPPVRIDDPTKPTIEFKIPHGADQLGFLLVAAQPERIRVFRVNVPVSSSTTDSWAPPSAGKVKADAGHDQVGLVGRRVTLNGSRSVPGDGSSSRWIKVSGPAISEAQIQGPFFSFIPGAPGSYRFVLLVAAGGAISEPDEVSVVVGSPPPAEPAPTSASNSPLAASTASPSPLERAVADLVARLPEGSRIASEIADIMKAIADRATFYSNFLELQSELTRRLDVVVPSDPSQRAAWAQGVFQPLSAYTSSEMLAVGLDLRQAQGLQQALTPAQQERIGEHFQKVARAFRADQVAR